MHTNIQQNISLDFFQTIKDLQQQQQQKQDLCKLQEFKMIR